MSVDLPFTFHDGELESASGASLMENLYVLRDAIEAAQNRQITEATLTGAWTGALGWISGHTYTASLTRPSYICAHFGDYSSWAADRRNACDFYSAGHYVGTIAFQDTYPAQGRIDHEATIGFILPRGESWKPVVTLGEGFDGGTGRYGWSWMPL